jgi:hypothetical protein
MVSADKISASLRSPPSEKGEDRERRREGAAQNYRAFSTDRWPDGAGIPGGAGGHDAVKAFSELN